MAFVEKFIESKPRGFCTLHQMLVIRSVRGILQEDAGASLNEAAPS